MPLTGPWGLLGSPLSPVRLPGRQAARPRGDVPVPLPSISHGPRQNGSYAAGTDGWARGGCKDRGVTARGTLLWMGEEEAPAPGAALWVGEGLRWVGQDCWVSPVPPSPPWTPPIHPAMPSLSPLGLFPWGWGEAGALPAPLPSSLPHFLATAAAWPSTAFFPPGAWSWGGGRPAGVPPCVQPNPAGQEQPLQEGEA